jgi:hypothetical protein
LIYLKQIYPRIEIIKINIEKLPELARACEVDSPTFMFFHKGESIGFYKGDNMEFLNYYVIKYNGGYTVKKIK